PPSSVAPQAAGRIMAAVAAAVCAIAVLLTALFLYTLPTSFFNEFGMGRREATHFYAAVMHRTRPEISPEGFQLGLRFLLTLAWAAYGAFLYSAVRCRRLEGPW